MKHKNQSAAGIVGACQASLNNTTQAYTVALQLLSVLISTVSRDAHLLPILAIKSHISWMFDSLARLCRILELSEQCSAIFRLRSEIAVTLLRLHTIAIEEVIDAGLPLANLCKLLASLVRLEASLLGWPSEDLTAGVQGELSIALIQTSKAASQPGFFVPDIDFRLVPAICALAKETERLRGLEQNLQVVYLVPRINESRIVLSSVFYK